MLIAVPSKGRAGKTKTDKILKSCTLFVPDCEYKQYSRLHNNIASIPDNIRGITATRNWILKNTDEKRVIFIDDDVKSQGYIKLYNDRSKHKKLTEDKWTEEFTRLFDITEDFNYKIFGVATHSALRAAYPYKPIQLRGYVTASCMGIINDGSYYFNEEYKVKEDYEICLRHIKQEGGILCARYLYWENSHWQDDGGCKDYRTQTMELDCIRKLIKEYPGMIKQVKRGGCDYSISLNL